MGQKIAEGPITIIPPPSQATRSSSVLRSYSLKRDEREEIGGLLEAYNGVLNGMPIRPYSSAKTLTVLLSFSMSS